MPDHHLPGPSRMAFFFLDLQSNVAFSVWYWIIIIVTCTKIVKRFCLHVNQLNLIIIYMSDSSRTCSADSTKRKIPECSIVAWQLQWVQTLAWMLDHPYYLLPSVPTWITPSFSVSLIIFHSQHILASTPTTILQGTFPLHVLWDIGLHSLVSYTEYHFGS